MLAEQWRQIESIYNAACELSPEERTRYINEACGSDERVREEVESLLANRKSAAEFLESASDEILEALGGEPVPSGENVGPYVVIEMLGRGGMGEVYKAHDTRLRRDIAIKFLPGVLMDDPAALERFQREARAASSLNHPNICTVHDVGEFQGRPYLVMELLNGQSLRDRIGRKPLPLPLILDITRQVCSALEIAHAMGIVHRDIKAANIFLTAGGQVKVLDFGLAKLGAEPAGDLSTMTLTTTTVPSRRLSHPGNVMGTLAYMSPEQARGEEVDARSDVYSLGVVLYEMVTGELPFRYGPSEAMIQAILKESPPEPKEKNPSIPKRLEAVILTALQKELKARWQSVKELRQSLDQWQEAEAKAAAFQSRRWVLAAAGAGVVSLAGGFFLTRRPLLPSKYPVRVAVLPFENIGGNPQEAFLANGLHQEMISVLSRLYGDQLSVIGSTASKRYLGASRDRVAKELNVDYIVEGGVQRQGGKAHVTARLVRAKDVLPVWNGMFDRDLGEIVAAQSEIAQEVGRGIERGLRPDGKVSAALARPLDAAAHEAYLRGDFGKAIELDSGYAAAYTGLANHLYYPGLFGFLPPQQAFPRMRDAAAKAIELDATQPSAHAAFGLGKLHLQWRWAEAEDDLQRALKLNPSDAKVRHLCAHTLLLRGHDRESADEMEKALDLDPFETTIFPCVGWHELLADREDKALEANRHAFGLDPDNWWASLSTGWAYEQKGMYQEALSSLRKSFNSNLRTASIAHVFGRSGNRSGAKTILEQMLVQAKVKYVSPYDIAVVYAGLDEKSAAFEWLNRAYEERAGFLVFVKQDPRFKTLRQERQFGDLVRRLGYPKA